MKILNFFFFKNFNSFIKTKIQEMTSGNKNVSYKNVPLGS